VQYALLVAGADTPNEILSLVIIILSLPLGKHLPCIPLISLCRALHLLSFLRIELTIIYRSKYFICKNVRTCAKDGCLFISIQEEYIDQPIIYINASRVRKAYSIETRPKHYYEHKLIFKHSLFTII
jgi:hypothetical protein